jgi:uncharacterized caspase-like protein
MPVLSHRWVLAVCLFLVMTSAALADKRVALVVGNSAYQKVGQLPNPAHDGGAIGALFKVMAFDVVEAKFDLGVADLRRALRDFTDQVHDR